MNLSGSRIVFVCPSQESLGEALNASRTATQLVSSLGVQATLIVRSSHRDRLRDPRYALCEIPPRTTDARDWLRRTIDEIDADVVVLADHENTALERTPFDNDTVYACGRPVIAMDSLQFAGRREPLTCALAQTPGARPLRRWWPREFFVPPLPPDVPVVTPVPVAGAISSSHPFAVYRGAPAALLSAADVRARLSVAKGSRLVVVARSGWAATAYEQMSRGRHPSAHFRTLRARRLSRVLDNIGEDVTLVELGAPPRVPVDPRVVTAAGDWSRPDRFWSLLAAADLFLTDNLTSGAAAQAACVGTPLVCLINSAPYVGDPGDPIDAAMDEAYPGWGFPYLVHPFGWVHELERLRTGNPFLDAVPLAEAYDDGDVARTIAGQLGSQPDLSPTRALTALLPHLPSAADVFTRVAADL